jgi:hypothetical protein
MQLFIVSGSISSLQPDAATATEARVSWCGGTRNYSGSWQVEAVSPASTTLRLAACAGSSFYI